MRTWFLAAITAAIVMVGLAGCSSAPTGQLSNPEPQGAVHLFSKVSGSGNRNLGKFTAGGTVSISGSCVGKGTATVSVPPTTEKFGIGCSGANQTWGQVATASFPVVKSTTFSVIVTAAPGTRWIVGGSATKK